MPHSLRARLSGLRYKGIITDKDYQRLCKALDMEKVLDDIKAEIDNQYKWLMQTNHTLSDIDIAFDAIKHFIDKHIQERSE